MAEELAEEIVVEEAVAEELAEEIVVEEAVAEELAEEIVVEEAVAEELAEEIAAERAIVAELAEEIAAGEAAASQRRTRSSSSDGRCSTSPSGAAAATRGFHPAQTMSQPISAAHCASPPLSPTMATWSARSPIISSTGCQALVRPVEVVREHRHLGVPAQARQLGDARARVLVRAQRPAAELRDDLGHAGERLDDVVAVGVRVAVERQPQALDLFGDGVAEGDLASGPRPAPRRRARAPRRSRPGCRRSRRSARRRCASAVDMAHTMPRPAASATVTERPARSGGPCRSGSVGSGPARRRW